MEPTDDKPTPRTASREGPGGSDGQVEDRAEHRLRDEAFVHPPEELPVRATPPEAPDTIASSRGDERERRGFKAMAAFSHMSILFGLPVFLVPLFRAKTPFTIHHAKTAGLLYLLFYGMIGLSFLNCGVFMPLALLTYIPAVVSIARVVEGRPAGKWGLGDLAERIFGPTSELESR